MKVFISSTRKDLDLAKDLARRLQQKGLQIFTEEDAKRPGEDWVTPIDRHLRLSDEIIVLLTEHAIASARMMAELGAAYSLQKKVTPILIGVAIDDLPPLLKNLPYIKYAELEDYVAQFKKRIGASSKVHRQPLHAN
jgi:hypothetical protein